MILSLEIPDPFTRCIILTTAASRRNQHDRKYDASQCLGNVRISLSTTRSQSQFLYPSQLQVIADMPTSNRDVNLGNLSFNGSVADIVIANLTVSNALLLRGNNTIPFRGRLLLDTITNNLGAILGNSTTLSGGDFNMVIEDGQSVIGGEHIPWVESVLAHSPLLASVPLTQLLQSALGSVLGSGIGSSLGGLTNLSVDHLLEGAGGDGVEAASAQARGDTSRSVASRKPWAGDLLEGRTLDVVEAARLYKKLTARALRKG